MVLHGIGKNNIIKMLLQDIHKTMRGNNIKENIFTLLIYVVFACAVSVFPVLIIKDIITEKPIYKDIDVITSVEHQIKQLHGREFNKRIYTTTQFKFISDSLYNIGDTVMIRGDQTIKK